MLTEEERIAEKLGIDNMFYDPSRCLEPAPPYVLSGLPLRYNSTVRDTILDSWVVRPFPEPKEEEEGKSKWAPPKWASGL